MIWNDASKNLQQETIEYNLGVTLCKFLIFKWKKKQVCAQNKHQRLNKPLDNLHDEWVW